MDKGRVDKKKLNYVSENRLLQSKQEMEELYEVSTVFKSHPSFVADGNRIKNIIDNLKNITH